MDNLQEIESRLFTAIRFPLIVLVVFIHVLPFSVAPIDSTLSLDENIYRGVSEAISHAWGNVAVPCFFLLSGYYFFQRVESWSSQVYYGLLGKRLRTLLVPYLLWNLLLVFLMAIKGYASQLLDLPFGIAELEALKRNTISDFMLMPIDFPLWYMRDLMYVSLLSPVFYYLIKRLPFLGLCIFILSQIIVPNIWAYLMPTTAFSYFGLGAWFALNEQSLLAFIRKFRWIFIASYSILPVLLWFGEPVAPTLGIAFYPISGGLVMFGTFGIIALLDWIFLYVPRLMTYCTRMSSAVFFIYASHLVYLENWIKGAFSKSLFYDNGYGKLVAYFLIPLLTIIVCLLVYRLMKRYTPRTLNMLTGSRS